MICFGGLFSGGFIIRIIRYVVFKREKKQACKDRRKFSSFIVAALVSNRHSFNPTSQQTMQLIPVSY